ncbi:hypothetical protein HKO22_03095 [Peptoniphilus sp. AGMB00490]|uniref:Uncharacterized protein n=1 Tax=Peptoniphilus faecalis TaxID=2731255 RepID=A0A848RG91_9FIRM|nr:hypothetical protein [Peptoniphilus faecalis]NMW84731.1 hypothetical protein [Peptoniphilus faecalis]
MSNETFNIYFDSGKVINSEQVDLCVKAIFNTLKKELPRELQTDGMVYFLLEEAKDKLKVKNSNYIKCLSLGENWY